MRNLESLKSEIFKLDITDSILGGGPGQCSEAASSSYSVPPGGNAKKPDTDTLNGNIYVWI
jgi:hypothetical protein